MNGQMITLYERGRHIPLVWTHLIPATLEGRALHNVQNAMFAAAMAFSLGIKLDAIRQGLRTFDSTFFQAPGRMNVFNEHPFKVLFDYGHNAHAVGAMADLAQRLDVHRPTHRRARGPGRPSRRGPASRSRTRWPGASTTTSAVATTACATARRTRCRACRPPRCGAGACRRPRSRSSRTSRRRSTPRSAWASRATCCWSSPTRWCARGSRSPSSGRTRPRGGELARSAGESSSRHRRAHGTPAVPPPLRRRSASAHQRGCAAGIHRRPACDGIGRTSQARRRGPLPGLIRDERGVRFAPETED